jgi:hypothetical protein
MRASGYFILAHLMHESEPITAKSSLVYHLGIPFLFFPFVSVANAFAGSYSQYSFK